MESEKFRKLFSLRSKSIFIKMKISEQSEEIHHNFPLYTFHFTLFIFPNKIQNKE